ncbi:MAG TPA: methyltransferase domain-containing protein [Casimicrobiaceae bacterium]|nr:methyltransferase domain-containing protein [Casimicrobiaceae bacterium]
MSWSPNQYLQYEDARLRPALDLLARIPLEAPRIVYDIGCGAGNVAQHLARRWPNAKIEGVDSDLAMLAKARDATSGDDRFVWTHADLVTWNASQSADLIYSNAALHWIDGHATLFPRLMSMLPRGGVLAVQMPDNFTAPSHAALVETARSDAWRERLGTLVRATPVAPAAQYDASLAPQSSSRDIWTTEYLQRLPSRADGEHPIVAWMRGSAIVPFAAALDDSERERFVADYTARVERLHPRDASGSVLFPFRRLFIVATR